MGDLAQEVPVPVELRDSPPPCSRCGGTLMMAMQTPEQLGSVLLELCPACDAGKPAAGGLIRWIQAGEGLKEMTPSRSAEMYLVLDAWMVEAMGEHGWVRLDEPPPSAN